MSNSRHITVNWKGNTYTFNTNSKIQHFDGYLKIRFELNPDPKANPTGVNVVTVEHDTQTITSVVSERGVNLMRSPLLTSLSDWINEYYQAWRTLQ